MDTSLPIDRSPVYGVSVEQMRAGLVWLMFAVSFAVKIEPAPCDFVFAVLFAFCLASGMRVSTLLAPLILLLLLYNIGGMLSLVQVYELPKTTQNTITSIYMAISGIFFACYIMENTTRRIQVIMNGYIFGATIAAIFGICGKLNILGLGSVFLYEDRATGLFKDPNVFSTYIILPCVWLIQGFMLGTIRHRLIGAVCLILIFMAQFLAFSRGAWINTILSTLIMVGLTFLLTNSTKMRGRILFFLLLGIGVVAIMLVILLSIPEVKELFLDRFTLVKNYDAGETGRFGNQLNAVPLLIVRPFGFGNTGFFQVFGLDPHNTFLNSFASYGWLGGISYIVLVATTIVVGLRAVFTRSPWQNQIIVVFACMVAVTFQGVQIDTEHWRHFYWMLGLTWGLFATIFSQTRRAVKAT
jgi:hypothetical protein